MHIHFSLILALLATISLPSSAQQPVPERPRILISTDIGGTDIAVGQPCVKLHIAGQDWEGYYMGEGEYMVRYSTYKTGTQPYTITSEIEGFPPQQGYITIDNTFPGQRRETDYRVGQQWYSDRLSPSLFHKGCQGASTVYKWRRAVMEDWGRRCQWLRD